MMVSGGGIVTRLAGEVARVRWIPGLEKKPGLNGAAQVIWHNAALVSTGATANPALGRSGILNFAGSISIFMASIDKAQIESRAWGRIAGTMRHRSSVSNAKYILKSAANPRADCP